MVQAIRYSIPSKYVLILEHSYRNFRSSPISICLVTRVVCVLSMGPFSDGDVTVLSL